MKHPLRPLRTALTAALLSACLIIQVAAAYGVGTVTASSLRMRESANTNSAILANVPQGTKVTLLEAEQNGWYKADWNGTVGYMSAEYLSVKVNTPANLGTGTVNTGGDYLNMRSGPGTSYSKVGSIPGNATLTIISEENGWYKTSYNGVSGYVSAAYVTLTPASSGSGSTTTPGTTPSTPTTPATPPPATPSEPSSEKGNEVVAYAKELLGTPYVYGTNGPNSYDCAAFTLSVYNHFGYKLNRSAAGQYNNGTVITQNEMQPGDLLLWRASGSASIATYTGIYIGNNQFIHTSSSRGCVAIDDMDFESESRILVGVRRIVS